MPFEPAYEFSMTRQELLSRITIDPQGLLRQAVYSRTPDLGCVLASGMNPDEMLGDTSTSLSRAPVVARGADLQGAIPKSGRTHRQ